MRSSEYVAKAFHEAYERLAPQFGYETRKSSAVPWERVPQNNRDLMVAVVRELMGTCISCTIPSSYVKAFEPPMEFNDPKGLGLHIEHGLGVTNPSVMIDSVDGHQVHDYGMETLNRDEFLLFLRQGTTICRVVVIG